MKLKTFFKKSLSLGLCFLLITTGSPVSFVRAELQDVVDTKEQDSVLLYPSDLVALKVYSLTRLSLSQQGIVDIVNADVNEIMLIGQTAGETQLFIWDEYGKRSIRVRVFSEDLDHIISRLNKMIEAIGIAGVTLTKNNLERKVVATGRITKDDKKRLDEEVFSGFTNYLINMTTIEGDLIQIDAQISELNTTLTSVLGFDWSVAGEIGMNIPYEETLPQFDGSVEDFFKIGDFRRTEAITSTVKALIVEGKGRILSKPSLIVTNGEQATFLVGGEIPVRSTTSSAGGDSVTENITYTQYGIDLTVKPEIINDKIDVDLNIMIRDIDASNAVDENVAFTTRNTTTKVVLNDGQTIVLAGLIKHSVGDTVSRVPFVSAIPLVGWLFRKKIHSPDQETEVVISLTPRIIRQKSLEQERAASVKEDQSVAAPEEPSTATEELPQEGFVPATLEEKSVSEAAAAQADLSAMTAEKETSPEEKPAGEEFPAQEDLDAIAAEETPADIEKAPSSGDTSEAIIPPEEVATTPDNKTSQAISQYVQAVQKRIAQNISFPYEAKQKGWKGTVVLNMKILSDGNLSSVSVKESSGQPIFDRDAINTAQILAPYEAFPAEIALEEIDVTIPIVYSPEMALEPASQGEGE
jgi:pilus assembly protein CpaC